MRTTPIVILILASAGALAACDGEKAPPPAAAPAPALAPPPVSARALEIEWRNQPSRERGTITGGGAIDVDGFQGNYHVTLRVPRGCRWQIGPHKGECDDDDHTTVDVPIMDRVGDRTLEELRRFDPQLTLDLDLSDGRAGSIPLPPVNVREMVEERLADAEHGPVLFGQEPEDPEPRGSLIWVRRDFRKQLIGREAKLHELDLVLIANQRPDEKGRKVCTGYRDNAGVAAPNPMLVLKETDATIYDRRTGEVVAKKVFPPDRSCPMFTWGSSSHRIDSAIPYDAIESWARRQIKR
jgi:hypothetical protein